MKRLIVGITGASGVIYGVRLLEALRAVPDVRTALLVTETAAKILRAETDLGLEDVHALAHEVYDPDDFFAPIASGSFPADGMVIAPCSVKSFSHIAHSHADNLLLRAADVTLKEGRRLVLVVRETPLHLGHLRRLVELSEMGAVILPPVPAFYYRPKTVEDIILGTVARVLDLFSIPHSLLPRWGENEKAPPPSLLKPEHPRGRPSSRDRRRRPCRS